METDNKIRNEINYESFLLNKKQRESMKRINKVDEY